MIPLSTLSPAASASVVSGRTPTARISKSHSSSLPLLSTTEVMCLPLLFASVTVSPRWKVISPLSSIYFFTPLEDLASRIDGRMRGESSTTSTLLQILDNPSAAFIPISPAPITTAFVFSFAFALTALVLSRSRNVSALSLPSTFFIGGTKGLEPVQRHSLS